MIVKNGTVTLAPVTNIRAAWRTSAVFSTSGPTMMPGVSHRNKQRDIERVAQLHEARGLVGAVAIDRARQMHRIVRDQPERPTLDSDQRGDHPEAEVAAQFEHRAGIGQRLDDLAHIINAQPVLRNDRCAGCAGRRTPNR